MSGYALCIVLIGVLWWVVGLRSGLSFAAGCLTALAFERGWLEPALRLAGEWAWRRLKSHADDGGK